MRQRDGDLVPNLVGAALESVPGGNFLAVLGQRATRAVEAEWSRNLSRTLALATERAGMNREDLADALEREPKLIPLVIRTFYAAGMNGHDKTLKLLAGFLGDALADVSHVDDVEVLVAAVSDMTEHHVRVLEILASEPGECEQLKDSHPDHWTTGLLVSVSEMRRELVLVGIQGLLNAGFVSDQGMDGGNLAWAEVGSGGAILSITEMGQNVIEVLREVEEASGP